MMINKSIFPLCELHLATTGKINCDMDHRRQSLFSNCAKCNKKFKPFSRTEYALIIEKQTEY